MSPESNQLAMDAPRAGLRPDPFAFRASAVQLYTALIYEGPGLVRRLNDAWEGMLEDAGCRSVAETVGIGPLQ